MTRGDDYDLMFREFRQAGLSKFAAKAIADRFAGLGASGLPVVPPLKKVAQVNLVGQTVHVADGLTYVTFNTTVHVGGSGVTGDDTDFAPLDMTIGTDPTQAYFPLAADAAAFYVGSVYLTAIANPADNGKSFIATYAGNLGYVQSMSKISSGNSANPQFSFIDWQPASWNEGSTESDSEFGIGVDATGLAHDLNVSGWVRVFQI